MYSGYKKFHCFRAQAIICPNGLIVDLVGPYMGSINDAGALLESGRHEILQNISENLFQVHAIYSQMIMHCAFSYMGNGIVFWLMVDILSHPIS